MAISAITYASRARARVTIDAVGAARDLNIAELLGTYNESPNAVRAKLAASPEAARRLLAAAVPPQVVDQNFEGVIFAGRVAGFEVLPEMRLPGPGRPILQPWYDLAASYESDGMTDQAINVYRAIVDRAPRRKRRPRSTGTARRELARDQARCYLRWWWFTCC